MSKAKVMEQKAEQRYFAFSLFDELSFNFHDIKDLVVDTN